MHAYAPILVLGAIAFGFAVFSIVAGALTGPKRYNRAKLDAYECGIEPTPQPVGGGRFPVKYYLTAMLFIVFDIEIVFLYPWAVTFDSLGIFGLVEMVLFILTRLRRPTPTCGAAADSSGTEAAHGYRGEAPQRRPADDRRGARRLHAQELAVAGDVRPGLLRHRDDGRRRGRATTSPASAWRSSAPRRARPT